MSNSLSNQRGLIVSEFGFNSLQTTLLGCVDGAVLSTSTLLCSSLLLACRPTRSFISSCCHYLRSPSVTSAERTRVRRFRRILRRHSGRDTGQHAFIPFEGGAVVQLLVGRYVVSPMCDNYLPTKDIFRSRWLVCPLRNRSRLARIDDGRTYEACVIRLTGPTGEAHAMLGVSTNAIMIIGYALGNAVGPQPWKAQYQPRNHVPWTVICVCWAMSGFIMLLLRWYLARENRLREVEQARFEICESTGRDAEKEIYLENAKGEVGKVDRAFLDLTDIENRQFRYVL